MNTLITTGVFITFERYFKTVLIGISTVSNIIVGINLYQISLDNE